jgi:pyruvate dehydrogenase E2 component (dihydrolipoamide acetyltransferase)
MAFEFELPDVGEGIAEGELVRWLVSVGDAVTEDQPLAEVETDKAMVEVPAPVDGTVAELRAEEGDMVPVGDVFVVLDPDDAADGNTEPATEAADAGADADAGTGDGAAATDDAAPAEGPAENGAEASTADGRVFAAPSARRLARELGVDIGAVEGTGPSGRVTERDVRAHAEGGDGAAAGGADDAGTATDAGGDGAAATAGTAEQSGATAGDGTAAAGAAEPAESADRERTLAAPATRRVADELDVDLDAVPAAEERDGEAFVDEAAVRQYAEAQQQAQADRTAAVEAGADEPGATADAAETAGAGGEPERVPYRGVRQTIGDAMVESKFTAPHVSHHDTAVVDDLVATRERLKPEAEERGIRLTYMPFVMKAVVAALKEHPVLNAELDEEAGEILRHDEYNVGVATATDAGLMVPVVDDVDRKGMLQISSEVNELVQKARDRKVSPDELQGSTFTVTNFGAVGGEYATPILNFPEVGILGIGELKQRPVVEDGEVVAAHTLPVSLSIDHRVVDGADAAAFANTFIEYVENPELLLLE